jgi:hypothetical protein
MRRTVRLTERDLTRLVRRVLREEELDFENLIPMDDLGAMGDMGGIGKKITDVGTEIIECAQEVLSLTDLTKVPTCVGLATEFLVTKKMPTDISKAMACGTELSKLNKTPKDGINFMNCVLKKIGGSPIMNTMESRIRRRNQY